MKISKLAIVSIVLLAILTLGAVSASDDADALAVSDDGDTVDVSVDENEAIALDSDDEVVGDGPEEKYNTTINVNRPDEIYYDPDMTHVFSGSVSIADDECEDWPGGDVVVYLNDEKIATGDADWFEIEVTFDEFGEYNFRVKYLGDENFNPSELTFAYNLTNSMYRISVPEYVDYGRNSFIVNSPVNDPSAIEITINGKKFNVYRDEDGDYLCNASALNYGLNAVKIYYPGDEDCDEYSADANITVLSYITCTDYTINIGDSTEVYVDLPDDATGTLKVYSREYDEDNEIDTEIASANAKDGVASVVLDELSVGSHRLYANFTGSVQVEGYDFWIDVEPIVKVPKSMITGEDAYVVVETSKDATDLVEVSYLKNPDYDWDDEPEYTFLASANAENGQAKISLSALDEGYYRIWVEYNYDEGSFGESHGLYVVDEYDVNVNITYCNKNVLVGDECAAEYEIAEYADGNITVIVDGKVTDTWIVDEDSVYFYFNTTGLSVGEHTLTLNFTSETQGTSSDEVKFNIVSATIFIPDEMNVNSQAVSANNIAVSVNSMAVGTLRILIDGKEYLAEDIDAVTDDSYYHYFLSEVSRGKHNVTVIYSDDKYGEVSESKIVDFGYVISIYETATYGVDNIIRVEVPYNLGNGDLTITLDGNKLDFVKNSSEIKINPSKLSIGNHTVIVKYAGDDFYPASEFNDTFEVYALIDYEYRDMLLGSDEGVSLILPGDAKGKLNVTVFVEIDDEDGWRMEVFDSQLVSFVNGKAYYSFASLPEGSYKAEASYTGDDYEIYEVEWYFEVTALDMGSEYLEIGENKTIIFVSEDNDCQLHVVFSKIVDDDKEWDDPVNIVDEFNVTVENGKATYTFTNMQIGTYHIFMTLNRMDGTFMGFQTGFTFYVEPPYVEAQTGNLEIGKIPSMNIPLPKDANGKVNVIVYENYSKEVPDVYKTAEVTVNGPTTIDLNTLIKDAGKFRVSINYTGNYGTFEEDYFTYKITAAEKISPNLEVTAPANVNVGDDVTVNVSLNQTITGEVLVSVAGTNYTVSVANGKGSKTISGLAEGTYQVTAKFDGNDAFNKAQSTASFKVSKVQLSSDVISVVSPASAPAFSIALPADAKGTLTVNVGGRNSTGTIKNGKASVAVSDLAVGDYLATVTYSGDAKYEPVSKTANVTVIVDPKVTAKATSVLYTANGKFQVTVYGTDGNLAKDAEVIFKIAGKQVAKATTNANGVAAYTVKNVPGTYTVTATALGASASAKLTVKHLVTLKAATVKKSAKKLVLQATLAKVNGKYLKNKQVTFKFNGKTYKAKTTSKGIAKITIKSAVLKKLKVGKKVTYQATYLKDTVKKTIKIKK